MHSPADHPPWLRIGVDTGGTFTDVVAIDERTGELTATKTPSTPTDPAAAFWNGIRAVLEALDTDSAAIASVAHGTTVATNHLLQGPPEGLGFVTTEGHGFLLEIARQSVPDGYGNSYFWIKPPRIVPAHLVKTVPGRLDFRGIELVPFDRERAAAVARWFARRGVDAIGVCFLHSYANPAHELAMREILAEEHPAAVVSISSDVLREYREYERSVTTLIDAAVKPAVSRYILDVETRLAGMTARRTSGTGDVASLRVMKSNGGLGAAAEVVATPITTVLSGPAAGALGAGLVGRAAGFDSVVTLDGGGTSTDVAVLVDGEPVLTTDGGAGPYPCKVPMVDVVTVGAGGGSVAWVSPEGNVKVGPRSAGAEPGPMCYGAGGDEPTVTDAHLLLGRLPPALLGGAMPMDSAAAERGLSRLGTRVGLDAFRAAAGVLEISAWNQANAIRRLTVERGLDVRDYPLVAFGGSGPLLACRLAELLELSTVLVPRDPGNLSAYGLLTVDVRSDVVRTITDRDGEVDVATISTVLAELAVEVESALRRQGFAEPGRHLVRLADLRYRGQAHELSVPVPDGAVDEGTLRSIVRRFHTTHEERYGYCYRDDPRRGAVEWVNLRVSGIGRIARPAPNTRPAGDRDPTRATGGRRSVHFDGWRDVPIYRRAGLEVADVVTGPAVIEEFGATVPLPPGFVARVDGCGNLAVTKE